MPQIFGQQNCVCEWSFVSETAYPDPFNDLELDVEITGPDGEKKRIPAYWAGGNEWRLRFAASEIGRYRYRTICTDAANASLHGQEGELTVEPYAGENALLRHGPIAVRDGRFQHADGTAFFWLGDTWWMANGKRFGWPEDFQTLTADRAAKGFSVIQLCAGFACGMAPFDPRDVNEAGWAWEAGFSRINPAYFDLFDLRIDWLVRSGLVPCILAGWGYHLLWMGVERMRRHWRYLIARYGAHPVTWCLAGEGTMPYYGSGQRDADREALRQGWTEIARYVRQVDPYGRPLTMHPEAMTPGRDAVTDETLLDYEMLQPGHRGYRDLSGAIAHVRDAVARTPPLPVINDEVNYEGIFGSNWEDMQRLLFWSTMLSGAAGFTYGASGIWEFNSREALFGPFPKGGHWGDVPWEDAYRYAGSLHVGVGRRILEHYPWWEMEPHQDWVQPAATTASPINPYCAGIPRKLRVCFFPYGRRDENDVVITFAGLEPDLRYRATYVDPRSGAEHPAGIVEPRADGTSPVPPIPHMRDWVLVLEAEEAG